MAVAPDFVTVVFDASTVLAILKNETGADLAIEHARGAMLSSVNLIEVRSKLFEIVSDVEAVIANLERLEIVIMPFTATQAKIAADLWPVVKGNDVSIADRVCLALAIDQAATLWTADKDWVTLGLALDIRLVR